MHTETLQRPPRTIQEVFDQLPEGTLAQLIENNIVMSPSPLFRHQKILNEINLQLSLFVKEHHLGIVLVAPMDVYLDDENVLQPDIIFISNERQNIIKENGLYGAPDLIIEILSPATAHYDMGKKKVIYEQYGVKEYWIIDPATKEVRGYYLNHQVFEEIEKRNAIILSRLLDATFTF